MAGARGHGWGVEVKRVGALGSCSSECELCSIMTHAEDVVYFVMSEFCCKSCDRWVKERGSWRYWCYQCRCDPGLRDLYKKGKVVCLEDGREHHLWEENN